MSRRNYWNAAALAAVVFILGCGPATHTSLPPGEGVYLLYTDSSGYTLVRNGDPFYVVGASGDKYLELIAEYGANTFRVYDPGNLDAALEKADSLGLAVVVDIPLPEYNQDYYDPVGMLRERREQVVEQVERYRDHPALLYWTLGNEIFGVGYTPEFLEAYNELAQLVHELDPHHPVSTAIIGHQLRYLKAGFNQVDVDFISLNLYGNITDFHSNKELFSMLWSGPYLFSEWGTNGYWEDEMTTWKAAIEPTSTKKAEQYRERYTEYIAAVDDQRLLGSLAFYWGQKYEQTPTWFSLFTPEGHISETAFELGNLWRDRRDSFPGPRIDYLLLDGKGGPSSILLAPGKEVRAESYFVGPLAENAQVKWDVHVEDWRRLAEVGNGATPLTGLAQSQTLREFTFVTPRQPGPYRLYYEVTSPNGYYATANIPFYVIEPDYVK